jgi:2-polyprenyl-6-methoxyphenol hydroxylase-like FAD-dependent oxidoreductase
MAEQFQVLIVGGGPVGVGLAVELGQRGIHCGLVERHLRPQQIPKGQGLTQRTAESLYFWGVENTIRQSRLLPPGFPIRNVTTYENLMSDYWYSPPGREVVNEYYFQKPERLPQYITEAVLRARLAELPNVKTFFGWTVGAVEQGDTSARVKMVPTGDGRSPFYSWAADTEQVKREDLVGVEGIQELEADYVVGCDGARSLVREQLGIDRGGADFDQRMVLAVLRSPELHEALKRFPEATTYRVLKPELQGYWQFFGRVDVGQGFFFHAPVPKDTRKDNYDFLSLIREAAGFEVHADLEHVGFWDLRIAVARRYRVGRAMIAGDACHSHPPYGGFGLNSGIEDARNIGWKLAAVASGWAGDRLLDSYTEERRPIFDETGESMIAGGIEQDRQFLTRYNPHADRPEFEQAWQELSTAAGRRQQTYEPHYEGSSVVFGPEGGVCSIRGKYTFKAQAGHHLAPQPLSSGRNVFEALGRDFTLLALGADDRSVRAFKDAAQHQRVPLQVIRDTDHGERAKYESKLVLVRPDQYVVWTGDSAPADATAIFRRITGTG